MRAVISISAFGGGPRGGGTAFARDRFDRDCVLLVPADRICRYFRTRADRRHRHFHCVRDHDHLAAGPAHGSQTGRRGKADRLCRARACGPLLDNRRNWIVGVTLAVAILGLPLLAGFRFDFNPLNLQAQDSKAVSTLLELMNDPDTTPNTIEVLKSNLAQALPVAERLRQLPEVSRVLTLQSFIPKDQDAKLALIEDAGFFFQNTLNPNQIDPEPTPAETRAAIHKLIPELSDAVRELETPAAVQARRLAKLLAALENAPPAALDQAQRVLVTPLKTTLRQVRNALAAEPVSLDTLPAALKRLWVSADGRALIEVEPSGHGNDNANLEALRNSGS